MNETKPHVVVRAIGWAILVTSLWSWIGFVLGWYWSFPIIFLCVFGIVLSAPLETVLSSRERWNQHLNYIKRTRLELYETVTKSVTNETETKTAQTREEAARAFWIEACKVWKATGNLGWRRGFQNFLSKDSDWSEWIKEPFCPKFAIKTSTGNGWTVIARDGITPDYVIGWLAGGNLLPLPPEGWPPTWRKPQTADTGDSMKQGTYSTDTADGATVYATQQEGIRK